MSWFSSWDEKALTHLKKNSFVHENVLYKEMCVCDNGEVFNKRKEEPLAISFSQNWCAIKINFNNSKVNNDDWVSNVCINFSCNVT